MTKLQFATAILMGTALTACGPGPAEPAPAEPAAVTAETPDPATTPAGWRTVTEPALGIAFDLAPGRRTGPCPEASEAGNCVALFEGDTHLISLQTHAGTLAAVAAAEAGFERNDKGVLMTTYGRFQPVPVESFTGPGWTGQKATVTCGISDAETGFHAAGGECLWAVVGDGRRAVVANTQGINGLDADTTATLMSVRFIPEA
ncbi:hypothetical protein [uncultured Brevundimonas sp.]|uniref:hypothetical protein n=1 Tax=uncultured Brevundimonas sp. TaxID=213418 RepID=UPI0030EB6230|tara:strand:- start:75195 stop:75803 length:609 start_codon:yes stop_codon:yes gene_type:complete